MNPSFFERILARRSPNSAALAGRRFLAGLGCGGLSIVALAWMLLPKPPLLDGISFSREVFDRHGQCLAVTLSADDKYRIYVPLRNISPDLIAATLAHEDRWFGQHPGINPVSLARSAWRFVAGGEKRGGASTITMQLARLRFGLHTRTISGKLHQIIYAVEIERHYSKDEILEAYLNLAPYGGNLEGIGAASLAIFRRAPSALSRYEALALSLIPQSPARRGPLHDRMNPALQAALRQSGGDEAASFPVTLRGVPKPEAPHHVRRILKETSGRIATTTLDRDLQRLLQQQTGRYLQAQARLDLRNAAVELYDWQTMELLVQIGSANFNDAAIHGQVDGTRARRSPGSTLKPFVYALAMQQGLIHPDSIVLDAPRAFSGYNPENSDREFVGPLRASDALARSRNVPAVELTQQLRHPGLYDFLQSARLELPRPGAWYGLALPLGGAEVRMEDLVRLYAMLANQGIMGERRLLTPEAAFLTLEMLGRVPPPEGYSVHAPVYWKTGTSHGYHDAWSVGVCGPYVLAVWAGNFDGRANPALMGRTAAAPLFFQILETLENNGRLPSVPHLPPPGANLRKVELCAESGQLPEPHCRHRIQGWFIPGVSPITTCAVHRDVIIDQATGLRLLADDGTRAVRREAFEFWPQDIEKLFAKAGLPRRRPPPFLPGQTNFTVGNGSMKILSPRSGAVFTRRADAGGNGELALRITGNSDTRRVFWFDGVQFLGSCDADQSLRWLPSAGAHQLTVMDQDGRKAEAQIRVEVIGNG
ncbi:MAG: penicillin-binding protein 1C [Verrucomicrobiota bacterium]